uniref:Transposable element P transposase-like RNase H C-terminal domain-containing protein n=1 Tax=Sipha flava TaxID=143950 RepID=A0A2S2R2W8_9HEMI
MCKMITFELYNVDNAISNCKMLPRFTDQHIIPGKILKIKVKNTTQVSSKSVFNNKLFTRNIISSDALHTATLYLFFDKIFDSLNGNFDKIVDGNIYRTSVKRNSPHHQLWVNSLRVLSTMRFEGKNGKDVCVPTIRNWTTTIRAFQTLYKVLGSVGIKSLQPHNLNQDSLECFFRAIRNVGSTNYNCNTFISAYKTLVLNNLVSSHSPGSNCEEDFAEGSLASFKNLFLFSTPSPPSDKIITADFSLTIH